MPDTEPLLSFERVRWAERKQILRARRANGLPKLPKSDEWVGLALSGGGIRSATFNLGVLQALAKCNSLRKVDYLSTVSGGGYVGSWLSAWIHRTSLEGVDQALKGESLNPGEVEPPEVTWLRRYSNYLAPKLGLMSADSMTLVATYLRNVMLNLVIFVTFLAVLFLLPRLFLVPAAFGGLRMQSELGYASAWLAFFVVPLGISLHFSKYFMQEVPEETPSLMNSTWGVFLLVIFPAAMAALLGAISLFSWPKDGIVNLRGVATVAATLLVLTGGVWLTLRLFVPKLFTAALNPWGVVVFPLAYGMALLTGGILVVYFDDALAPFTELRVERTANTLTFGPPALLLTMGVMGSVVVGMVGTAYAERTREWWSRMNAWFIIVGVAWLLLVSLSFYAAPMLAWAYANLPGWVATLAGAGWFASLLTTLFAKGPASKERLGGKLWSATLNIALLVVIAGLLLLVAGGVGFALESWKETGPLPSHEARREPPPRPLPEDPRKPVELRVEALPNGSSSVKLIPDKRTPLDLDHYIGASFKEQERIQRSCVHLLDGLALKRQGPRTLNLLDCSWREWKVDPALLVFLVCAIVCGIFTRRVNVNKFSLHNMYKNRLIRCYLGASHQERKPHPFIGFDDSDDVALSDLCREKKSAKPGAQPKPQRPFHIVNAAINITQGRHLAWQERRAASFTFSPLHCGFMLGKSTGDAQGATLMSSSSERVGGYRKSDKWASKGEESGKFSLGMAMATSGAAFSPIRGQGSTPATAFLATMFNIRLGRWSPNPMSRRGWTKTGPAWGGGYLLQELFGYSTETSRYVYLSDGGHFDNTGVYELIRRKCTTILAVDATADYTRGFDDLANLVRKCRVDFGVEIEFRFDRLGIQNDATPPSKGYVVGTINYPGKAKPGKLILIKPTLIKLAALGVDLFSYSRGSRTFPHQTTVDQFFSESQFESYRKLGERIACACFDEWDARL